MATVYSTNMAATGGKLRLGRLGRLGIHVRAAGSRYVQEYNDGFCESVVSRCGMRHVRYEIRDAKCDMR